MKIFFHLLLPILYTGWANAKCVARPPASNLTSTVGPIVDDPVTDSSSTPTTAGPTNQTCMIPFLAQTMLDMSKSKGAVTLFDKDKIQFDDCNDRCTKNDTCAIMNYYPTQQWCRLFGLGDSIPFVVASCYTLDLTTYLKVTVPTADLCTPLYLYRSLYNSEIRQLPDGKNYKIDRPDNIYYQMTKVA